MAKHTTITVETTSLLILRFRNSGLAWCAQCAGEVEMIALEHTGMTPHRSTIEEWLNSGDLHRSAGPDGAPFICLNSLLARLQSTKPANCGVPRLPKEVKERL
jgi:hypothetical protein